MNIEDQYKKIIESLRLLSLSLEEQEKYFPEFVEVPFETIDTFDNAILQLPILIEMGKFDNMAIASILRIQNFINFTLSDPKFTNLDDEQFRTAPEWNKVREMARDTLKTMKEPITNPDPNYL